MAGNRKFHNKFHSANHHTLPSPHIRDSGLDPIASHEFPFIGDFVLNGVLSASNNYTLGNRVISTALDTIPHGANIPVGWNVLRDSTYIDGDCTITGNLSALGEMTYLHTEIYATSAAEMSILAENSDGEQAGLTVDQHGKNDIVHFKNDGLSVFKITGHLPELPNVSLPGIGGRIGINLGNLENIEDPNQRMTIVGSVSVVGDPHENADQSEFLNDPGESGSMYIAGGLHVDSHAYLDQTTINTTDGAFVVSGDTILEADVETINPMDLHVPVNFYNRVDLRGETVVAGDSKLLITAGDNNDVGLEVQTKALLGGTTVNTSFGDFVIVGDGAFEIANSNGFSVAGHIFLNQTTIDTKNGEFLIENTSSPLNTNGVRLTNAPLIAGQTTIDTRYGEFLVQDTREIAYELKTNARFDVPLVLNKVTIDTTPYDSVFEVTGVGSMIVDVAEGATFNTNTTINGDTIFTGDLTVDLTTGPMVIQTTTEGLDNNLTIDVPVNLNSPTHIDTRYGNLTVMTTDGDGGFDITVPTTFKRNVTFLTGEAGFGNVLFSGDQGSVVFDTQDVFFRNRTTYVDTDVFFDVDKNSNVIFRPSSNDLTEGSVLSLVPFNITQSTLSAGNTVIDLRDDGEFVVQGSGTATLSANTDILSEQLYVDSSTTFNITKSDLVIDDSGNDIETQNTFRVNTPTVTQALTSFTNNGDYRILGTGSVLFESQSIFNDSVLFNTTVRSMALLESYGATVLSNTDVILDTTDDEFTVYGAGRFTVRTIAEFTDDVSIDGDLTVAGNVFIRADDAGFINLGNETGDRVVFTSSVASNVVPDENDAHNIGAQGVRWLNVHAQNIFLDEATSTIINTNDLRVEGWVDIETTEAGYFRVRGNGESIIYNPLTTKRSITAEDGPWLFTGDDPEIDENNIIEALDEDGFSYELPEQLPPKFTVETRSLFKDSLSAYGPVKIGDLPEGEIEQLNKPTLEILGTTVISDGNLKLQSDIRHLDDNSTLIRFNKNQISLNILDEPAINIVGVEDKQHITIGNKDFPTDFRINTDIGIFGPNEIIDVFGRGIDLHGNMRVTETLSATNLVVDYLTVLEQATGNIGGGTGSSGLFRAYEGTAFANHSTRYVAGDGSVTTYLGTDTGLEFDVLLTDTRDIQTMYSFTFEALSENDTLGVSPGDTQSTTYQFAARWNATQNTALVNDVEYAIITTATNNFATITSVVVPTQDPLVSTDSFVKIIVQPQVDCKFVIHNVLVQEKPERINAVSVADLDVAGTLTVLGEQRFTDLVHLYDDLKVDKNVHILGDLTVDGNLHLKAGSGGNIFIGDSPIDNVSFNAGVDSNVTPTEHAKYDLGVVNSAWNNIHAETIHAKSINSTSDLQVNGSIYFNSGIPSNLVPSEDDSYVLGSSHYRWSQLHANTVNINYVSAGAADITTCHIENLTSPDTTVNRLTVIDDLTVQGRINVNITTVKDMEVYGEMSVNADTYLLSGLDVEGTGVFKNDLHVFGNMFSESLIDAKAGNFDSISVNDIQTIGLTSTGGVDIYNTFLVTDMAEFASTLYVSGDGLFKNDIVVSESLYVSGETILHDLVTVKNNVIAEKNMHIKGDLVVDGNLWLSAGDAGSISIGNLGSNDNIVFNADINSSLLPREHHMFNIGSDKTRWNGLFVKDAHISNTLSATSLSWGQDGYTSEDLDYWINFLTKAKGDYNHFAHLVPHWDPFVRSHVTYNDNIYHCRLKHTASDNNRPGTTAGSTYWEIANTWTGAVYDWKIGADYVTGLVIPDSELPDAAFTKVHYVQSTSQLNDPDFRSKVFQGHVVVVIARDDKLIATVDHPDGEFILNAGDQDGVYRGYELLAVPFNVVRSINNRPGPTVLLTADDIPDEQSNNKFATQSEIDLIYNSDERLNTNELYWNQSTTLTQNTSAQWNAAAQSLQDNTSKWNDNVSQTNYISSVKTNTLTRSSSYLSTPEGSREYIAMQSDNSAQDGTWEEITYDNAMVLPFDTYIKEVIIRSSNSEDAQVIVGVHTNENQPSAINDQLPYGSNKEWIYFAQTPVESTSMNITNNHQPTVFTFSSTASAAKLSTLGLSVSANKPLENTSITIIYEYVEGDIQPELRNKI